MIKFIFLDGPADLAHPVTAPLAAVFVRETRPADVEVAQFIKKEFDKLPRHDCKLHVPGLPSFGCLGLKGLRGQGLGFRVQDSVSHNRTIPDPLPPRCFDAKRVPVCWWDVI